MYKYSTIYINMEDGKNLNFMVKRIIIYGILNRIYASISIPRKV